jgi:NADH pyrophosphatase NudC (nudix superfamily)
MDENQAKLFRQIMDRCKYCPTCGTELEMPIVGTQFRKYCPKRHGAFSVDEINGLSYHMYFG